MKKILSLIVISVFFLSGCLLKNNSQDIIKITSENLATRKNFSKINKIVSLSTGANLLKTGDINEAIKFFKEYESFYSKNPKYYDYLGQAYFKKGLYKQAAASFEKSLALDSSQIELFLNIAYTYEKTNNKHKATENFINYVFKVNDDTKSSIIRSELNKIAEPSLGNGIIGRISVTDRADVIKNLAIGEKQAFNTDTPVIFASIELINAKKLDKIEIKWNFINDKEEIIPVNYSNFADSGAKTILTSIDSPDEGWPSGKYEMQVLVNGVKNSSFKFYIF